jgi:Tol biopolymer transport system component
MRNLLLLLPGVLGIAACRDTEPFLINRPGFPDSPSVRLTYNAGDDRAPAWSADSDSIYFVADGYPPFPIRPGLVLAIPSSGGDAAPLFAPVQVNLAAQPRLEAVAANANHVAFVQITEFVTQECAEPVCGGDPTAFVPRRHPQLQRAVLRVRRNGATVGPDEFQFAINFAGARNDSTQHPFGLPYVKIEQTHPFHRLYNEYGDAIFRPSWSPDGQRLVFSDGLNLYLWQAGSASATVIPNTADAVWPAWSPDGQTIAFTRLPRLTPLRLNCLCVGERGDINAAYDLTLYPNPGRIGRAWIIQPNGSGALDLGAGTAPAWTPDSRNLLVARDDAIYRINIADRSSVVVPNTAGGFEPAVSPNGNALIFARENENGTHDLYRVRLQ